MSTEIRQPAPPSDIASLKPLGSLELQVMQIVWQREEVGEETTTVRQVFEGIRTVRSKTAYLTFMTIAHRLRDKKWLKQVK